jgi:hypothetical protein
VPERVAEQARQWFFPIKIEITEDALQALAEGGIAFDLEFAGLKCIGLCAKTETREGRQRTAQGDGRWLFGLGDDAKTGFGGMQIEPTPEIAKLDTQYPPLQIAEAPQGFGVEAQYPVADLFNQWCER